MKQTIKNHHHYSFLSIGKTKDSSEVSEGFKRYVGIGTSKILTFNPTKEKLDEIMGFESSFEPVYVDEKDGEKQAHIHFIVETDPDQCGGVDIKNKAMFTLKLKPALNSDGTMVQVLDNYGNYARISYEDAKAHKPIPSNFKIDQNNYRIACEGEVDLTVFLKKFLGIPNSMDYTNGAWTVKKDADDVAKFRLEHIKDYMKGDFSEIKEALDYQPNNKIKLLYGVKTKEDGKTLQVVCTNADYTMHNNINATGIEKVRNSMISAKNAGRFANIEYRVEDNLQEYTVQPTNLDKPAVSDTSDMPWEL